MDMLPTSVAPTIELSLKVLAVIGGVVIIAFNYFHTKESLKMERKLNIVLPGSVSLTMSLQMLLSLIFLTATIFFLIFL